MSFGIFLSTMLFSSAYLNNKKEKNIFLIWLKELSELQIPFLLRILQQVYMANFICS